MRQVVQARKAFQNNLPKYSYSGVKSAAQTGQEVKELSSCRKGLGSQHSSARSQFPGMTLQVLLLLLQQSFVPPLQSGQGTRFQCWGATSCTKCCWRFRWGADYRRQGLRSRDSFNWIAPSKHDTTWRYPELQQKSLNTSRASQNMSQKCFWNHNWDKEALSYEETFRLEGICFCFFSIIIWQLTTNLKTALWLASLLLEKECVMSSRRGKTSCMEFALLKQQQVLSSNQVSCLKLICNF